MKQAIPCILLLLLACGLTTFAQGQEVSHEFTHSSDLEPDQVGIAQTGIVMPLGRILLVRKGTDCCAVKFTSFWTGKTEYDQYGRYEVYYQGDGTGDFSAKNVKVQTGELKRPKPWGIPMTDISLASGNITVRCGPMKLTWISKAGLYFWNALREEEGDHGVELAPTPWTGISEVNLRDPRIRWYRYGTRQNKAIPVDRLWPETQKAQGKGDQRDGIRK